MMGGQRFAMPICGGTVAIVVVRLLAIGVAVILATSAIQKSIDPRNTVAALEWAGLPGDYGVRALVAWEMILAAGLGIWVFPRITTIATTLTFVAFSGWIVVLIVADAPVGCGCKGGATFEQAIAERPKSLFKSGSLSGVSLLCVFVAFRGHSLRPSFLTTSEPSPTQGV